MKNLIGWAASTMLAVCAIPQAIYTLQTGDTSSFDWTFLIFWTFGDLGLLYYTWAMNSWALRFNYGTNAFCVGIIMFYKIISVL